MHIAVSQNQSLSGLHSLRQSDSTKIDGCELSINFLYSRQEMYLDLQVCFFLDKYILVLKSIFFMDMVFCCSVSGYWVTGKAALAT